MPKRADEAARDETFVDYRHWMDQDQVWPRSSLHVDRDVVETPIAEMSPQHAISAYRKLGRWTMDGKVPGTMPTWNNLRRGKLARALLEQAVGEEVTYAFETDYAATQEAALRDEVQRLEARVTDLRGQLSQANAVANEQARELERLRAAHKLVRQAGVTIIINGQGEGDDELD